VDDAMWWGVGCGVCFLGSKFVESQKASFQGLELEGSSRSLTKQILPLRKAPPSKVCHSNK